MPRRKSADDPSSDGGVVGAELGRSQGAGGALRDEFTFCLLSLVAVRPMSAYEVNRILQTVVRYAWGAAESQVYSGLARLEQHGLVAGEEVVNGRRSRRTYSITEAGRTIVDEWLAGESPPRSPKDVFLLKLFFMGESTDEAALNHLLNHRAHLSGILAHGTAMRERHRSTDPQRGSRLLGFQLLTLDFAIARHEAELALVDQVIETIREGGSADAEWSESLRQAASQVTDATSLKMPGGVKPKSGSGRTVRR